MYEETTIAAIATSPGEGGIGIIRISGIDACCIADKIFQARGGKFAESTPYLMRFGHVVRGDKTIVDEGLAVFMKAPHSYTGEDVVEIQIHGSMEALRQTLALVLENGAVPAARGEFTKRAFLNGRLDLTQAEAVMDVIEAKGAAALSQAESHLSGKLSSFFHTCRDELTDLITKLEVTIDYPEEDLEDLTNEQMEEGLVTIQKSLADLLQRSEEGRIIKDGLRTAIVGRPNAGKSSLLNALLQEDRAIVTDIPGTTRDTVEESVLCGGVLLRLIDTAGIRATEDPVEQLGVERSRRAIASAELVLAVVDGAVPEDPEEGSLLADVARCGVPWLLVFTKRDMAGGLRTAGAVFPAGEGPLAPPAAVVSLSSVTGEGLEDLGNAVAALFPAGDPGEAGSLLTDRRQEDAARRALDAVRRALEALETGMTPDAVLTDAEEALDALGELTGRTAKEEIVSRIFSRFCVGK